MSKFKLLAVTAAAGFMSVPAFAALDLTAVGTSLTGAQSDALGAGELVIGVVAALIVVGLVIGMVRKV